MQTSIQDSMRGFRCAGYDVMKSSADSNSKSYCCGCAVKPVTFPFSFNIHLWTFRSICHLRPQMYHFPCGACQIFFCRGAVETQTRWCWLSPSVIYFPNYEKQPKISFWEKEAKGENVHWRQRSADADGRWTKSFTSVQLWPINLERSFVYLTTDSLKTRLSARSS